MEKLLVSGVDYDLADPLIRCNGDKAGASVVEISVAERTLRVLTAGGRDRALEVLRDCAPDGVSVDVGGDLVFVPGAEGAR